MPFVGSWWTVTAVHPHARGDNAPLRRMYARRYDEAVDESLSLQQLRGREGIRVRAAYAEPGRVTGVEWKGRSYDRASWKTADPINRALSCANSCLYGVCHAAIIAAGYSPAIGFIHSGKALSFVYDVADLYKSLTSIPAAFGVAGAKPRFESSRASAPQIENATRARRAGDPDATCAAPRSRRHARPRDASRRAARIVRVGRDGHGEADEAQAESGKRLRASKPRRVCAVLLRFQGLCNRAPRSR